MQNVEITDELAAQLRAVAADTKLSISRVIEICCKRVCLAYIGSGSADCLLSMQEQVKEKTEPEEF